VVPRIPLTLELPLTVIQVAWIVKPALVVDVEVPAVARVGVITRIEVP
jgi:hypothetical protein